MTIQREPFLALVLVLYTQVQWTEHASFSAQFNGI